MKSSRSQAAANRERILEAAGRLFRERGLDGIGVAELMAAAGLTHGGFYAHFESKEALMAQACGRALEKSLENWRARSLAELVTAYLSPRHRDQPGSGCAIAALGSDVPRQGRMVRRTYTEGVRALVEELTERMPGRTPATRRRAALALLAGMVGALLLARAVDDAHLSDEILQALTIGSRGTHTRA